MAGYLEHERLAVEESAPERFFMNVVLARVLFAHALVAAPRVALGRLAGLARTLGDPRLGMAGVFLSLRCVVPNDYPLAHDVEWYIADEQRLGRLLDHAVIVPRLQRLYECPPRSSANHACSSRFATANRFFTRATKYCHNGGTALGHQSSAPPAQPRERRWGCHHRGHGTHCGTLKVPDLQE